MNGLGTGRPLAGRGIAVTRPRGQAQALAALIEAAGGKPIVFPLIEIAEAEDQAALAALIDRLGEFDLAVFISPSAVDKALDMIRARRKLPASLALAAVGAGTARALQRLGAGTVIVPPERFDSEALLDLPQLRDVAGKRVVIFRGEGGRELLGDTLRARGASVEYAQCYRRLRPEAGAGVLLDTLARGGLHAITLTSSEGARNLLDMTDAKDRKALRRVPVFASHPRIADAARELGFESVHVTGTGDEGLLRGLVEHFSDVNRKS